MFQFLHCRFCRETKPYEPPENAAKIIDGLCAQLLGEPSDADKVNMNDDLDVKFEVKLLKRFYCNYYNRKTILSNLDSQ